MKTPTFDALSRPAAALLAVAAALVSLRAQEGVPQPQGLVPEQMWPAPTAEDWKKPVPIQWQRTWEDAVRLSQETKKPILVCVNMDGEIASEHYAGIRYRDPEIAKLFEPYVCVIASVYRHNPRDYDEQGRRIECPRLGCVTCGEHIALEPLVYEKFLDGKRISPRHIMVELDGSESYDVFYTWDVVSVLDTLRDGIKNRTIQALPVVKGDRSLLEKIASPDSSDRAEVEKAFAQAQAAQKQAMLEAALKLGENAPIELLRQAMYGLDPELAQKARGGLLAAKDPGTVDLLVDSLQTPVAADERKALVAALRKFGAQNQKARIVATAHEGLAGQQTVLDTSRWQKSLTGAEYAASVGAYDAAAKAAASEKALATAPKSPEALLDLAEASLVQALETGAGAGPGAVRQAERMRSMLLEDAERTLQRAVDAGATGWRPAAAKALLARERGRTEDAYAAAVLAAPELPPDAPGRIAMEVLALFAEARQEAIVAAVRGKQEWPGQWMTDVHATYSVLARHPLGTDRQVAHHYDFLKFFGAPDTDAVLDRGLARFAVSPLLHERHRARILAKNPVEALERDYEQRLAQEGCPPAMQWYAGYASLVAAEQHRRRNRDADALAAYGRAIGHYEQYRDGTGAGDGAHYLAMAHGGVARVVLTQGDLDGCFAALERMFATSPAAAAAVDGLSVTGMQTAEMLRGRALDQKRDDLLTKLAAALKALPPEAFELPEYERASRGQGGGQRGQRRGR
ncbi:MAG: hypothetical protein RL398_3356 [Planctomycetota bacterium]|jgi:hypothetical protein